MTPPERVTGHPEGGWVATGVCGARHLAGRGWAWWRCRVCAVLADTGRARAKDRINAVQARRLALYYPAP